MCAKGVYGVHNGSPLGAATGVHHVQRTTHEGEEGIAGISSA